MVESKSDASPVTEADRQAEEAMRALLSQKVPTHAIFGEEGGMQAGEPEEDGSDSGFLWVLDPIDGTKSFITGEHTSPLHLQIFNLNSNSQIRNFCRPAGRLPVCKGSARYA